MATRPIFRPSEDEDVLVDEILVDFPWHPGMSPSQKRKNVQELHRAAERHGLWPLLEISSKSEELAGQRLSAFNLKVALDDGELLPLENAFQGSKVFVRGGPYQDLYSAEPGKARRDPRIRDSGRIVAFKLGTTTYPSEPPTGFYDWLYLRALFPHIEWLRERLRPYAGFTDIEFNPDKSINCQARSLALLVALDRRGQLVDVANDYWALTSLYAHLKYWRSTGPSVRQQLL